MQLFLELWTLRYLLDHGANPDKLAGHRSATPLHLAAAEGQLSILFFGKPIF